MPRIRLRFKFIILLLSLAVIPLLLVSILNIYNLQKEERIRSLDLGDKVAQLVAEQVKSFISIQFSELEQISTTYLHYSKFPAGQPLEEYLDIFLFKNPNFVDIAIINKEGDEITRKNAIKIYEQKDLTNRKNSPEFAEIEHNRYFIGPLYFENGRPYMQIGQQLTDNNGQFAGEIIGVVDVRVFQDLVKYIASSNNNWVYIVDQNGRVVAHPDFSVVLGQKNYSNIPAVKQIISHDKRINSLNLYTNDQKQQVIGLAIPIKLDSLDMGLESGKTLDTYLIAVSEQLSSVALYPVEQVTRFSSAMLILVLVGSILITLVYSNIIVSPIEKVYLAAKKLGLGDFEARVNVNTKDEIEDLASSFNQMAESIKNSIFNLQQDRQLIAAERNKLKVALSGISDAVIAVDTEKRVIIFNKAAEDLTGYTITEAFGKPLEGIIKVFDNNTEIPVNMYCPVRPDNFEEITYNRKGLKLFGAKGKQTYVNLLTARIKGGVEVNLGCILTLHDISEEKQLDAMKLDFVSMAAHELRTPLTVIRNYMYIFLRDYKAALNEKQSTILSRVNIASQRLNSLVENLLNVTRIEKGKITLNIQSVDWVKNIEEVIAGVVDQAKDKRIQLNFIKPEEPIFIHVDSLRINEVLVNLLANAITFTPVEGKITIWVQKANQEIITHVRDTGKGIPREALPHLFTKFFRVSGSLEQGSKGTGLGLYIAKSIVEMHKGKIWVESEFGQGSTFSFSLPLSSHLNIN